MKKPKTLRQRVLAAEKRIAKLEKSAQGMRISEPMRRALVMQTPFGGKR